MGQNAKVLQGTTSRVWRSPTSGFPAPSNGTFYTDLGFQNIWESSRNQPGDAGIITDYLGGKAGLADPRVRDRRLPRRPPQDVAEDGRKPRPGGGHRLVLGHLSLHARQLCQRQGLDNTPRCWRWLAEPALDGRLQFAGEHTSSDFLGFMNGGVQSGNRAAAALIEAMALQK